MDEEARKQKQREYARAYYQKNREKVAARQKAPGYAPAAAPFLRLSASAAAPRVPDGCP